MVARSGKLKNKSWHFKYWKKVSPFYKKIKKVIKKPISKAVGILGGIAVIVWALELFGITITQSIQSRLPWIKEIEENQNKVTEKITIQQSRPIHCEKEFQDIASLDKKSNFIINNQIITFNQQNLSRGILECPTIIPSDYTAHLQVKTLTPNATNIVLLEYTETGYLIFSFEIGSGDNKRIALKDANNEFVSLTNNISNETYPDPSKIYLNNAIREGGNIDIVIKQHKNPTIPSELFITFLLTYLPEENPNAPKVTDTFRAIVNNDHHFDGTGYRIAFGLDRNRRSPENPTTVEFLKIQIDEDNL